MDIVIGTHRLLSKDVLKKLGLVIVDEEQRFGVRHKRKLTALTKNINVLTLTQHRYPELFIYFQVSRSVGIGRAAC